MVLRGVDCKGFDQPVGTESGEQPISVPRLRFHTDRRSPKHKQLLASPRCSVLFYCKASKLQIRVNGIVELEELDKSSDVATAAWRGSSASSRRCYYMEAGPSESTSLERLRTLEDRVLSADAANENATSPHFACLMVDVHQLEFLYLAHTGARRALASYRVEETSDGSKLHVSASHEWLIP